MEIQVNLGSNPFEIPNSLQAFKHYPHGIALISDGFLWYSLFKPHSLGTDMDLLNRGYTNMFLLEKPISHICPLPQRMFVSFLNVFITTQELICDLSTCPSQKRLLSVNPINSSSWFLSARKIAKCHTYYKEISLYSHHILAYFLPLRSE